jgi:hypothetical protein
MNRFQVFTSIVGTIQIVVASALASQSVQPPLYQIPAGVAFALVLVNVGLIYLQAQLPSWRQSGRADAALDRAERRQERATDQPDAGGDFVG